MHKKRTRLLWLSAGLVLAALVAASAVIIKHEPHFYRAGHAAPGAERKQLSIKFVNDFAQLLIAKFDKDEWHFKVTEAEINSFFEEDFVKYGEAEKLRELGISEPRVAFDDGRVRFGFRYGTGWFSTVLSYELRVWAVPKETNLLAVEIVGRRAGALPISCQSLLTELSEMATQHNIEVTPYRHEGHTVAVLRLQADQPRPTMRIKYLHISPEELTFAASAAR
jgi:hypothetical protein